MDQSSIVLRETLHEHRSYRQVFPSKYVQLVSPDFTFQVFSRGACPFSLISTTKSARPNIGSFSRCGLAWSGTWIQNTEPEREIKMRWLCISTPLTALWKLFRSARLR